MQRIRGKQQKGKDFSEGERNLFKKIGNIKGKFHPKICTVKDRNDKDLIVEERLKMRWKEHTKDGKNKYKKDINDPNNQDCVVSHPELDILECEVSRALGSTAVNKASRCDGIPVEQFKTLKDDAIKMVHPICQQIWKTQQWPQDWKRLILTPIPKKGSTKEGANHQTVVLIS